MIFFRFLPRNSTLINMQYQQKGRNFDKLCRDCGKPFEEIKIEQILDLIKHHGIGDPQNFDGRTISLLENIRVNKGLKVSMNLTS